MASATFYQRGQRLHWVVLVLFLLLIPVTLPVSAFQNPSNKIKTRRGKDPFLAFTSQPLFISPSSASSVLAILPEHSTYFVLRQWISDSGDQWFHVKASGMEGQVLRGWICNRIDKAV